MRPTVFRSTLIAFITCLSLSMAFAGPERAIADEQQIVSREIASISGTDAITAALSSLRGVVLGSGGATVTVEIEGETRDVPVTYSGTMPGGGSGGDLLPLLTIGAGIGILGRAVRILSRLMSRSRG